MRHKIAYRVFRKWSNSIALQQVIVSLTKSRVTETFREEAAGFELTSVQFAALDAIAQQPGIDQASLAATISFDRATIGGVVDRLEQKGLLRREVSAEDRRARRLSLTPAGQRLLGRLRPVVEALQAEILAPLTRAEQAAFLALAQKALGLPPP